ncbi:glycerophosphodiester phosphodiesterase [Dyadobacter crusticola]|uniref:glycerophosphodiester phosphodiesterase n=1 Tax=Dyadobacter crusticola TaxID=292407 RepID=UPI0004E158C2|nr:glycerophosphodiester phosphodiesterase family protein [Dyadobacter crusticola]
MKFKLAFATVFLLSVLTCFSQNSKLTLIAHRGGVVDSSFTENCISALKAAVRDGYKLIETDVRVTKDGVLIANHDADFRRYYEVDKKVTEVNWAEIRLMKSKLDGNSPLLLEDILRFCAQNKLGIMLDNKIAGFDSTAFTKLIDLLDKYQLRKSALMIGTDESTDFFTGKIRLSCSRAQLEENMRKSGYQVTNYFLFERPARLTNADVQWARKNGIMVVAAINKYHYRQSADMMADAARDCRRMLSIGITSFQIDSEFRRFLVEDSK